MQDPPGAFVSSPPTTRYLWQVIQPYKLETYLEGGLWFSRLDTFKDGKEGTLPLPNIGILDDPTNRFLPVFGQASAPGE